MAESAVLFSLAYPGCTIVDAGANLGYYTLSLARLVGATGRILAFEPEPRNFLVLAANVLLWRALGEELGEILLYNSGLSSCRQQLSLQLHVRNFGFHRIQSDPSPNEPVISVETLALDEVVSAVDNTGRARVRVLKADVQGHELPLLQGAEVTIAKDRPILCLEFEPYVAGAEACHRLLDWLEGHDYRHLRLIYADARQPRAIVGRLVQPRSVEQLRAELQRDSIAAYATLLAYPAAVEPR